MKKVIILLCAFLTMALCPALANEQGFISVQKEDYIELEPDMAEMQIAIETSDKDINKATNKNKAKAQEVYKALAGVLDDGDYLKTNSYSINPRYATVDGKKVLDTYIVTNSITLKTCNLTLIPKIIDTAVENGANRINNLNLTVANFDNEGAKLVADLTKKAKKQAEIIAASMNSKVAGVKRINANYGSQNKPRYYSMALNKSVDSAAGMATPFEKGKVKIYGNVDAEFYVK